MRRFLLTHRRHTHLKSVDDEKKMTSLSDRTGSAIGSARRLLRMFGPGLVTGAADDDPSGIATYSPGPRLR
jgi:hypothetical protein